MTMTTIPENRAAPSTALVKARQSNEDLFKFGLEPQGLEGALSLCKQIADAGIFPNKDGTNASPASLLVRLMTGRSLNVPAMISLKHVYEVYGQPSISARLKVALCLRHPECEKFELVESTNTQATYLVKRAGMAEAKPFKYTIEDARQAQLVKKDSAWEKSPRRMLEARASSHGADVIFPDACMGLPTVDEAEEDGLRPGEVRGEVVPPTVPARDWAKESEAIKAAITEAIKTADSGKMKDARARMKTFAGEAPDAVVQDLTRFYNTSKDAALAKSGAVPTKTDAKAEQKAEPKPETAKPAAPAASAQPRGEYLPPSARGDSYDGPDDEPLS